MLRRAALLSCCMLLGAIGSRAVADKHASTPIKNPGLERFKQLAGEWVGKEGEKGPDVRVTYRVTANGNAVMETIAPGTGHEMVTLIHPDGDALVLTHYCILGNQPHMKATLDGNTYKFDFVSGTNMKSENDMHMHSAAYTFVDDDTLHTTWTMYQDGKKTHTAVFDLKRKK